VGSEMCIRDSPYDDITVVDYVYCDITPVSGAVEDDIGVTDYVNVAVV